MSVDSSSDDEVYVAPLKAPPKTPSIVGYGDSSLKELVGIGCIDNFPALGRCNRRPDCPSSLVFHPVQCASHGLLLADIDRIARTLTHIDLFQPLEFSLPCLSTFTALVEVYIAQAPRVTAITGLQSCPSLQRLFIVECGLTSMAGLSDPAHCGPFPSLTHLNLCGNAITRISGLERLSSLTHLTLDDNKICAIGGLECCTNLAEVHLARNCIGTIGGGLDGLDKLVHLSLSDNSIASFSDIARIASASLPCLTRLDLSDPHWGDNPVCGLPNYAVFCLITLPHLTVLDTVTVTHGARHASHATFTKKRMYYHMRMQTLLRNLNAVVEDAAGRAVDVTCAVLQASLPALVHALKVMEAEGDADGPRAPASNRVAITDASSHPTQQLEAPSSPSASVSQPPASPASPKHLHDNEDGSSAVPGVASTKGAKLHALQQVISRRQTAIHCLRDAFASLRCASAACLSSHSSRVDLELNSGGNLRVEEGRPHGFTTLGPPPKQHRHSHHQHHQHQPQQRGTTHSIPRPLIPHPCDPWHQFVCDLVTARFNASDFAPLHVTGVRVTRVVRIHGRHLKQRFDRKVADVLASTPHLASALATAAQQQQRTHGNSKGRSDGGTAVDGEGGGSSSSTAADNDAHASLSTTAITTTAAPGSSSPPPPSSTSTSTSSSSSLSRKGVEYVLWTPRWEGRQVSDGVAEEARKGNQNQHHQHHHLQQHRPHQRDGGREPTHGASCAQLLRDCLGTPAGESGAGRWPARHASSHHHGTASHHTGTSSSSSGGCILTPSPSPSPSVASFARVVQEGFANRDASVAIPCPPLPFDYATPPPPTYASPSLNIRPSRSRPKRGLGQGGGQALWAGEGLLGDGAMATCLPYLPFGQSRVLPQSSPTSLSSSSKKKGSAGSNGKNSALSPTSSEVQLLPCGVGIPVSTSLAGCDLPRLAEAVAASLGVTQAGTFSRCAPPAHMAANAVGAAGGTDRTGQPPASSSSSSSLSSLMPTTRPANSQDQAYAFHSLAAAAAAASGISSSPSRLPVPLYAPPMLSPTTWLANAGLDPVGSVMTRASLARALRGGQGANASGVGGGGGATAVTSLRSVRSGSLLVCRAFTGNCLDLSTRRSTLTSHIATTLGEGALAASWYGDPALTPAGQAALAPVHCVSSNIMPTPDSSPRYGPSSPTSSSSSTSGRMLAMLDPSLLLPEFYVEFEYVFDGEDEDEDEAAQQQHHQGEDDDGVVVAEGDTLASPLSPPPSKSLAREEGKASSPPPPLSSTWPSSAVPVDGDGVLAPVLSLRRLTRVGDGLAVASSPSSPPTRHSSSSAGPNQHHRSRHPPSLPIAALATSLSSAAAGLESVLHQWLGPSHAVEGRAASHDPAPHYLTLTAQEELDCQAGIAAPLAHLAGLVARATGHLRPDDTRGQAIVDVVARQVLDMHPRTRLSVRDGDGHHDDDGGILPLGWWRSSAHALGGPHVDDEVERGGQESVIVTKPASAALQQQFAPPLVPSQLMSSPTLIASLSSLTSLSLVNCGLSGPLQQYGLAAATGLRHLDVSFNGVTSLQGIGGCASLWRIDARYNDIASLMVAPAVNQAGGGGTRGMDSLQHRLTAAYSARGSDAPAAVGHHGAITSHSYAGSAASSATGTRASSASSSVGPLSSLLDRSSSVLSGCRFLQCLHLEGNRIAAVVDVAVVGTGCPLLRELDLRGNPVAEPAVYGLLQGATTAVPPHHHHRRHPSSSCLPSLLHALPSLDTLDGRRVTEEDRLAVDGNWYRLGGGGSAGGRVSRRQRSPKGAAAGVGYEASTEGNDPGVSRQAAIPPAVTIGGATINASLLRRRAVDDQGKPIKYDDDDRFDDEGVDHRLTTAAGVSRSYTVALPPSSLGMPCDTPPSTAGGAEEGGGHGGGDTDTDGDGGAATPSAAELLELRLMSLDPPLAGTPVRPSPAPAPSPSPTSPSSSVPYPSNAGGRDSGKGTAQRRRHSEADQLVHGARTVMTDIRRAVSEAATHHPHAASSPPSALSSARSLDLSRLFLSHASLTSRHALISMACCTRLRHLDLSHNEIGPTLAQIDTTSSSGTAAALVASVLSVVPGLHSLSLASCGLVSLAVPLPSRADLLSLLAESMTAAPFAVEQATAWWRQGVDASAPSSSSPSSSVAALRFASSLLSPIAGLAALTRLDLSRNHLTDAALSSARLSTLPHLSHLLLEGNRITSFVGIAGCRALTEVYLGNNDIGGGSDRGDREEERVSRGPAPSPSTDAAHALRLLLRPLRPSFQPRLTILDLAHNPITATHGYREYALVQAARLRVLDGCGVSSEEVAAIRHRAAGRLTLDLIEERAEAAAAVKVEVEAVGAEGGGADGRSSTPLVDDADDGVGAAYLSSCTQLDLSSCGLREADLLSPLDMPRLATLVLDHNSLTGDGIAGLCLLLHSPAMRCLSLTHNKVTSMLPALGLQHVAADGSLRMLPGVLSALSSILPRLQPPPATPAVTCRLETLDLSHNGINTMEGMGLDRMPALRTLILSHNDITRLAGVAGCANLRTLHLDGNTIRAIDADAASSLAGCENLQTLSLADNGLRSLAGLATVAIGSRPGQQQQQQPPPLLLPRLTTLLLHGNRLADVTDLDPLHRLTSPQLQSLTASNNPAARKAAYRQAVLTRLPGLSSLDGREVSEEERAAVMAATQQQQQLLQQQQQQHQQQQVGMTSLDQQAYPPMLTLPLVPTLSINGPASSFLVPVSVAPNGVLGGPASSSASPSAVPTSAASSLGTPVPWTTSSSSGQQAGAVGIPPSPLHAGAATPPLGSRPASNTVHQPQQQPQPQLKAATLSLTLPAGVAVQQPLPRPGGSGSAGVAGASTIGAATPISAAASIARAATAASGRTPSRQQPTQARSSAGSTAASSAPSSSSSSSSSSTAGGSQGGGHATTSASGLTTLRTLLSRQQQQGALDQGQRPPSSARASRHTASAAHHHPLGIIGSGPSPSPPLPSPSTPVPQHANAGLGLFGSFALSGSSNSSSNNNGVGGGQQGQAGSGASGQHSRSAGRS